MTAAGRVVPPPASEPATVLDPATAERLAGAWVAEHHPGRRAVRVRTHSVLRRGPHEVSARIGVALDGRGPDDLTLLVREARGDVSVSEFPDDPLLPSLAAVLRGGALRPLLRDAGLGFPSGAPVPGYRATVVHHPREGACVVRVQVGGAETYAKVYARPEDAVEAAERLYAVGTDRLAAPGGRVVRLPRVLAVDGPLATVLLESLTPGGPPDDRDAALPLGADDVAAALRALHDHHPRGRLPLVSLSEPVRRVRTEQRLVGAWWPDLAQRVDDVVDAASSVLDAHAPDVKAVLCHGDFTPGQLVRVEGGLGLLDLDTVALGDPASDIGRFLAYEQVRAARGAVSSAASGAWGPGARGTFLTAYGSLPGTADASALGARVWAHRRLNLALIALRAARRLKGARSALALELLDDSDPPPGRHA